MRRDGSVTQRSRLGPDWVRARGHGFTTPSRMPRAALPREIDEEKQNVMAELRCTRPPNRGAASPIPYRYRIGRVSVRGM